jgi:hypothetical protein
MAEGIIARRGSSGGHIFFGDGSDGILNTSTNVTLPVDTEDVTTVVRQYSSITINSGNELTVSGRCRGLILYSTGNVVINGTINMNSKSACYNLPMNTQGMILDEEMRTAIVAGNSLFSIPRGGAGGNGGKGAVTTFGGAGGTGSIGYVFGGGRGGGGGGCGIGGYTLSITYGAGGRGGSIAETAIVQGAGGTGISRSTNTYGHNEQSSQWGHNGGGGGGGGYGGSVGPGYGGHGGTGIGGGGGGGGFGVNSTTRAGSGENGKGYGGGAVYIIAKGNITIGATGFITAHGGDAGNGGTSIGTTNRGGGGGGSGGGVVLLAHGGSYSNSGNINVSGGLGGVGAAAGTEQAPSGSIGSIEVKQIALA